jgi:hypothetical protein
VKHLITVIVATDTKETVGKVIEQIEAIGTQDGVASLTVKDVVEIPKES